MRKLVFILAVVAPIIAFAWSIPLAAQQGQQTPRQEIPSGNLEHGRYIVTHVAMCIECHSPRDEDGYIIPGQEFTGASIPTRPQPGWATRAPRNRGLLGYTDRQAMRLLTQGAIARDGGQLLLPMPRFRMTPEDAGDVIAYLRSLH